MAKLTDLPSEIILEIASYLSGCRDLAALDATCWHFHSSIVSNELYKRDASLKRLWDTGEYEANVFQPQSKALAWAAENGFLDVAKRALAAGSDVDGQFASPVTMGERRELLLNRRKANPSDPSSSDESWPRRPGACAPFSCTPLHLAIYNGHAQLVRFLLVDGGASLSSLSTGLCHCLPGIHHFADDPGCLRPRWRPLHTAICRRHDSIVAILIDAAKEDPGRSVDFGYVWGPVPKLGRGPDGFRRPNDAHAFHDAAFSGNIAVIEALLKNGFAPPSHHAGDPDGIDVRDDYGVTPLAYAFVGKQWDTMEWLIGNGALIKVQVEDKTLLRHAVERFRDWSAAFRLLDFGAFESLHEDDESILKLICVKPSPSAVVPDSHGEERLRLMRRLLEMGAAVDEEDDAGHTPLMWAAELHDLEAMDVFIEAGANVKHEVCFHHGTITPLVMACLGFVVKDGDTDPETISPAIDKLLDAGADVKKALVNVCHAAWGPLDDVNRVSPIAMAHLLKCGADPNLDVDGFISPMKCAFDKRRIDLCQILLQHGAHISVKEAERLWRDADSMAWVAGLKLLSSLGYENLQLHLVSNGHRILENVISRQPWREAIKDLEELLDHGVGPTANEEDMTLLHHACRLPKSEDDGEGAIAISELLIARGFDVNAVQSSGDTPLNWAIDAGGSRLVQVLCDNGADPHFFGGTLHAFDCAMDVELSECTDPWSDKIIDQDDANSHSEGGNMNDPRPTRYDSDGFYCPPRAHWTPLRTLLQYPMPTEDETDENLGPGYVHSLFELATRGGEHEWCFERLARLPSTLHSLFRGIWRFKIKLSPTEAGIALAHFLYCLVEEVGELEDEGEREHVDGDEEYKSVAAAVHNVVHILLMLHADVDAHAQGRLSAVDKLEEILVFPQKSDEDDGVDDDEDDDEDYVPGPIQWKRRLARAAAGVVAVEVRDGKKVIVLEPYNVAMETMAFYTPGYVLSWDDRRYSSADLAKWEGAPARLAARGEGYDTGPSDSDYPVIRKDVKDLSEVLDAVLSRSGE